MGEYEPHDSRNITLRQERAPGEPPRTGPREAETRQQEQEQDPEQRTELEQDERDPADLRERSIGQDAFDAARRGEHR